MSEHATWSALVYQRVIDAALAAVGAPPDLVRIVTGFGEAGNALVTGGIDKLIFVGSTAIGHKVGRCERDPPAKRGAGPPGSPPL